MGKLTRYIILISGIMLLFFFTGLMGSAADLCGSANPNNLLLCILLSPEELPSPGDVISTGAIVAAIQGIAAVGIVVGALIFGQVELAIIAPFAIILFNFLWNILDVFLVVSDVNPVIAILIFAPLLLMLSITLLDWWRRHD